ncbi:hypothetical protein [Streptomyces sp. NBC_00878]|uniref:hypothetical protein n=1 Tax=Streptomyces sp. NBC_00878 TaxID=2975854 RepID=UPI0022549199|nr:hypothetical protein [Streptomyces sp. NBC_00878]MCX4906390.1 hypothetical protein [Streptomyces sp. NBC_00878]
MTQDVVIYGGLGMAVLAGGNLLAGNNDPGRLVLLCTSVGIGLVGYSVVRALWLVLGVMFFLARYTARTTMRYAVVGKSLAGGPVSKVAARLLPRSYRDGWLHDVRESTYYSGEYGFMAVATLLGNVVAYPWVVMRAWLETMGLISPVPGQRPDVRQCAKKSTDAAAHRLRILEGTVTQVWHEMKIAVILALLAAFAIEPVWHLSSYVLHHFGLVWPWEFYFPLH